MRPAASAICVPTRPARPVPKPTSLSSGRGRHLGMSTPGHIPKGRGFQESLVYFEGAEDHNTQRSCQDPECIIPIPANASSPYDLWVDDGPATASPASSTPASSSAAPRWATCKRSTSKGPFLHLAPASSHTPLEPPPRFLGSTHPTGTPTAGGTPASARSGTRSSATSPPRCAQKMWESTLLAFSSDNGGPVYWAPSRSGIRTARAPTAAAARRQNIRVGGRRARRRLRLRRLAAADGARHQARGLRAHRGLVRHLCAPRRRRPDRRRGGRGGAAARRLGRPVADALGRQRRALASRSRSPSILPSFRSGPT